MGQGILFTSGINNINFELTANMVVPSFVAAVPEYTGSNTFDFTAEESGKLFFVPSNTIRVDNFSTSTIPNITVLSSVSFSRIGNRTFRATFVTDNRLNDGQQNLIRWPGQIFQVQAKAPYGNEGIYVEDSTNYLAITDATRVGTCLFSQDVYINGAWEIPQFAGFDRSSYMVFANWNNGGVTLTKEGNHVRCYNDVAGGTSNGSVTARIVIFGQGTQQPPIGGGICMYLPNNQIVFSSRYLPFVWDGRAVTPTWSAQQMGDVLVPLGVYGGRSDYASNTQMKTGGIKMYGGNVMLGRAVGQASWPGNLGLVQVNSGTSLPILPASKYR